VVVVDAKRWEVAGKVFLSGVCWTVVSTCLSGKKIWEGEGRAREGDVDLLVSLRERDLRCR
jgi:hypothetical protein